jgi:hypothetical protein
LAQSPHSISFLDSTISLKKSPTHHSLLAALQPHPAFI